MPQDYNGNAAAITARQQVTISEPVGTDTRSSQSVRTPLEKLADYLQYLMTNAALKVSDAIVSMSGFKITNLGAPAADTDADTQGARNGAIGAEATARAAADSAHAALMSPHGATAAATANQLALRDANGDTAFHEVTASTDDSGGVALTGIATGTGGSGVSGSGGTGVYGVSGVANGKGVAGVGDTGVSGQGTGAAGAGVSGIGAVNGGPGGMFQSQGSPGAPVRGAIRLVPAGAPSSPQDGDMWVETGTNTLKVRINGVTKTVTLT